MTCRSESVNSPPWPPPSTSFCQNSNIAATYTLLLRKGRLRRPQRLNQYLKLKQLIGTPIETDSMMFEYLQLTNISTIWIGILTPNLYENSLQQLSQAEEIRGKIRSKLTEWYLNVYYPNTHHFFLANFKEPLPLVLVWMERAGWGGHRNTCRCCTKQQAHCRRSSIRKQALHLLFQFPVSVQELSPDTRKRVNGTSGRDRWQCVVHFVYPEQKD